MSCAIVVFVIALASNARAEVPAELDPVERLLVGSWKSPDLGLDFPIWMVDTFAADRTVRTDVYSKPRDEVVHHKLQTKHRRWRVRDGVVEVGAFDEAGVFVREGKARVIRRDDAGKAVGIDDWTPTDAAATAPSRAAADPAAGEGRSAAIINRSGQPIDQIEVRYSTGPAVADRISMRVPALPRDAVKRVNATVRGPLSTRLTITWQGASPDATSHSISTRLIVGPGDFHPTIVFFPDGTAGVF